MEQVIALAVVPNAMARPVADMDYELTSGMTGMEM
jgi:hypothetical protein